MADDNPFPEELDDNEIAILGEVTSESTIGTSSTQIQSNEQNPGAPISKNRARYEALKKREAELLRKQQELNETQVSIIQANNWPPFFPILHYSPEDDLDPAAYPCVKNNLIGLCLFASFVIFNLLSICLVIGLPNFSHARSIIMALIQGIAGIYIGQTFSYEKLYQACQNKDIPFSWTLYQFLFLAWMLYLILGFPNSGSVGFATFLDLISKSSSIISKIVAALNVALIITAAVFEFFSLVEAQKYQKVSGIISQPQTTVEQTLAPIMREVLNTP